jgi:hypothetical protein
MALIDGVKPEIVSMQVFQRSASAAMMRLF